MTIIIMAIIGVIAGFVLDELIARLAREPYEHGVAEDGEHQQRHHDGGAPLELSSEAGALEMPRLLTTGAPYRRIVVVAATAGVFALLGRQYHGDWHLAIVAFYASVLIICTATDIVAYRVPNAVTYPAIIGAFIIGMVVPGASPLAVAAGGLLFGGLLFVPSILTGGAMGMGDVKLALFIGFALGLSQALISAMLIMAMSGGLAAAILLITRLRGKGDPIPYAPFIAGGALVAMLIQGTAFYNVG